VNDQLQDQMLRFGGGSDSSTITAGTAIFVAAAILLLFLLPKKYTVAPFLFASLFIPYGQLIVIGGLHFNVYRTMLPFAWLRVLMGRSDDSEHTFKLNGIDKAVILWAITDAVCATLLWGNWAAVVNRFGFLYNSLGIYFLLRCLIRGRVDVERVIRILAVACVLFAGFMVLEQVTGRNVFSVFGGVPEITVIREGKLRSQAVFAHAIVAGTVGANLLPLFIGLWWQGAKSKMLATAGIVSALVMTITASSATPIGACIVAIGALCMWRVRHRMKTFRWGLAVCLVGLNMVMKAPVWALIERISIVGGNSGYHRYELVNQAILHFGEWFLLGTKNPSSWGFEMGDVSNAYVAAAVEGGFFTLLFFLAIFWQSFRQIGLARQAAEEQKDKKLELQIWSFGAALMATVVAYFGITYFDQSALIWWALLAMICAITSTALERVQETSVESAEQVPPWAQGRVPLGSPGGKQTLGATEGLGPVGLATGRDRLTGLYRRP
jgi:hypothetical protein